MFDLTTAALTDGNRYGAAKLWAVPVTLILVVVVGGALVQLSQRRWAMRAQAQAQKAADPATRARLEKRASAILSDPSRAGSSVVMGADGRLSTSKTVAAAWTVVVAYVMLALVFSSPQRWDVALRHFSPTYLLLFTAPYAAVVLAKAIVNGRLAGGTLQKTQNLDGARLADLISDDSGKPDLFAAQYLLFNIIAIAVVIAQFVRATSTLGLPALPTGLLVLTALPAAIYIANKALASNQAQISTVTPTVARPGDLIRVLGVNFAPDAATGPPPDSTMSSAHEPTVEIDGVPAVVSHHWTNSQIALVVPIPVSAESSPLDVAVVTAAGQRVVRKEVLRILSPALVGLSASRAKIGDTVEISGSWSPQLHGDVHVLVDGVTATVQHSGLPSGAKLRFVVPHVSGALPRAVEVCLGLGPLTSRCSQLEVTE